MDVACGVKSPSRCYSMVPMNQAYNAIAITSIKLCGEQFNSLYCMGDYQLSNALDSGNFITDCTLFYLYLSEWLAVAARQAGTDPHRSIVA